MGSRPIHTEKDISVARRKRTTKVDFDQYRQRVLHWKQRLGLSGWDFDVVHENDPDGGKVESWAQYDVSCCHATIGLPKSLAGDVTVEILDRWALHEVVHIYLARYVNLAHGRYVSEQALKDEEESLVVGITSLILGE